MGCLDPDNQQSGNCKGTCGQAKFKGDNNCDDDNNNCGCEYDGGDCCPKTNKGPVNKKYCKKCECLDPNGKQAANCKGSCGLSQYKGDGNRDDENNNCGCQYDGGDCCEKTLKKAVVKKYCKKCECLDPNGKQSSSCKGTCGSAQYKGDGNCDDDNNNCGCGYDGGDCCKKSVKGGTVQTKYCKECKCKDPKNGGSTGGGSSCSGECKLPNYKGDGNCDDENNNCGCAYDGGDCCAKTVDGGTVKTKYCKKCECLDPKGKASGNCKGTCGAKNYKGDGNCDDNNNNCGCQYDGGDCCAKTLK